MAPVLSAGSMLGGLFGCAPSELPGTQVVVTVSGDVDVLSQLVRLEASVYPADATSTEHPIARQTVPMVGGAPLSFGIARGTSERFVLSILGYGVEDPTDRPRIEFKTRAGFTPDRTMQLDVRLTSGCLQLTSPCAALDRTCLPSARACVPVGDASLQEVEPGAEVLAVPTPSLVVDDACRGVTHCSPDYPCVPTERGGHTCLGQFADWPMPDRGPGSAHAPSYDLSIEGLVRDRVTGLVWQRQLPHPYPDCSAVDATKPVKGSWCTWDEAKVYCSKLELGGLRWRLPSKVELESIHDPTHASGIDPDVFPGCDSLTWTSSAARSSLSKPVVQMYLVNPGVFQVLAAGVNQPGCVRCVSGVPTGPGTPEQRYVLEAGGTLVRDTRTGLVWQREPSPPFETVDDAMTACARLGDGFRLPAAKELLTLVDPMRHTPAMDPLFVTPTFVYFWTMPGYHGPLLMQPQQGVVLPKQLVDDFDKRDFEAPRARCVR